MKKKIAVASIYFILGIILCLALASRFLPFDSYGVDDTKIMLESKLNKYINYYLSEEDQGTLVQYEIKSDIEYGTENSPIESRENIINFGAIEGKYPKQVKMFTQNNQIEQNSQYDAKTGTLQVQTTNVTDHWNYFVVAEYDTYTQENVERQIDTKIVAKARVAKEENREINAEEQVETKVTENIGELTSIDSETEEIYNGYMKANVIYGTNNSTQYKQNEQIIISKKEAQSTMDMLENNTLIRIEDTEEEPIITDLGNQGELIYKNTKLKKADLEGLLGKEGKMEIFDQEGNNLAIIDENTPTDENGIITINYETEQTAIKIKTTEVKQEGILTLQHTKEIKNTIIDFEKVAVKTTIQQEGKEEQKEIINKIQEAQTTININLDQTNWTNNNQNEVNFDLCLEASSSKNNLFKNPKLQIEFPSEVEKVILGENSIIYANGLVLEEPYIANNETGNLVLVVNLTGEQAQYLENNLEMTDIKIQATVILKKDIESTTQNIQVSYTNEYTLDGSIETGNKEIPIQIENYQEQQETSEENVKEENKEYEVATAIRANSSSNVNPEDLKLEVAPTKGDMTLKEGDIVYEGEYIKYNIKLTNTTKEDINNVKIVATIPDGVTYGELQADYYHYLGSYKYNFQEEITEKEIPIETIKAGETVEIFYEVKVNDLPEEEETKSIITTINTCIGEQVLRKLYYY